MEVPASKNAVIQYPESHEEPSSVRQRQSNTAPHLCSYRAASFPG